MKKNVVSTLKKIFPHNFRYEIGEVNEGGNKTRFYWNIEAIKALKDVESEKRLATESEQKVMSKYAGWDGIPQAFDKNAKGWEKEYAELQEMLTDEEYANARASVNNAFYTNPEIARAVNETLTHFGLKKGNVLEPSMGTGIFFGTMTEGEQKERKLYGVEIDPISGRIAKQLYQTSKSISVDLKTLHFQTTSLMLSLEMCHLETLKFMTYGMPNIISKSTIILWQNRSILSGRAEWSQ